MTPCTTTSTCVCVCACVNPTSIKVAGSNRFCMQNTHTGVVIVVNLGYQNKNQKSREDIVLVYRPLLPAFYGWFENPNFSQVGVVIFQSRSCFVAQMFFTRLDLATAIYCIRMCYVRTHTQYINTQQTGSLNRTNKAKTMNESCSSENDMPKLKRFDPIVTVRILIFFKL